MIEELTTPTIGPPPKVCEFGLPLEDKPLLPPNVPFESDRDDEESEEDDEDALDELSVEELVELAVVPGRGVSVGPLVLVRVEADAFKPPPTACPAGVAPAIPGPKAILTSPK